MKKLSLTILLACSLGGCATQFGTRTIPFIHHKPQVHAAPVAAPVAVPALAAPETFRKRWLRKFFVKRATEK